MTAQQLKNSILQLAVQGKLVPQDPNDEPASVLLERITKERERLIKEKKIKKPKTTSRIFRRDGHYYESVNGGEPACIDELIPFDIPESWEWVRLENLCSYIQRGKSPKYSPIKKYPVIAQKCNQWSGFSIEKAQFIAPETLSSYAEERILQNYDLLWNSTGLGTLGRMAVYEAKKNPYELAVADSHVTVIRPLRDYVTSLYLFYYFANPSVQSVIEEQSDGSTKQKELSLSTVKDYLVPLPPTAEQLRIEHVIKQVSPAIGDYDIVEQKLSELNETLPALLKKSILQHAIQGKLVPQDPNDEPASVLLERIAVERAKLGKKAAKSMSRIERRDRGTYEIFPDGSEKDISGEIPFDIPDSWEWCRLGAIASKLTDGSHNPPPKKSSGYRVISAQNIRNGKIEFFESDRFADQQGFEKENPRTNIKFGDVILGIIGGSIGNTAIYDKNDKVIAQRSIAIIRTYFSSEYLVILLQSPLFQQSFLRTRSGTAQGGIYLGELSQMLLPVPPMQEQARILMALSEILDGMPI